MMPVFPFSKQNTSLTNFVRSPTSGAPWATHRGTVLYLRLRTLSTLPRMQLYLLQVQLCSKDCSELIMHLPIIHTTLHMVREPINPSMTMPKKRAKQDSSRGYTTARR